MTRLHINDHENYSKATSSTLLSKIQNVVNHEIQNSHIFMTSTDMMEESIDILDNADDECDANDENNNYRQQQQQQRLRQATSSMSTTATPIPEFHVDEIITGRVLGRGGFCYVSELNEIRLIPNKSNKKTTKSLSSSTQPPTDIVIDNTNNRSHNRNKDDNKTIKMNFFHGSFGGATAATSNSSTSSSSKSKGAGTTTENNSQQQQQQQQRHTHTSRTNSTSQTTSTNNPREYLARRVWSKQGNKYVVKQVDTLSLTSSMAAPSSSRMHDKKVQWMQATIDIMLEAKYLTSLSHPHIISVRGTITSSNDNSNNSDVNKSSSSSCVSKKSNHHNHSIYLQYGIIFDHLPIMLTSQLNEWMQKERRTTGLTGLFLCRHKKKSITNLLRERLFVAHDIAEALDYLHSNHIIYRDLKPDNIGFDYDGILKIFDFGLAKELKPDNQDEYGLYHNMTGLTGAIRYMAPEVGLNKPYNMKADVYSWSMVFWYIMALEPPMGMYTPNMFVDRVFKKQYRPAVYDKWSSNISALMKQCWNDDINSRPNFRTILNKLRTEIKSIDPDVSALFNESNHSSVATARQHRSTHSQADYQTEASIESA